MLYSPANRNCPGHCWFLPYWPGDSRGAVQERLPRHRSGVAMTETSKYSPGVSLALLPERLSIFRFEPSVPLTELPEFTGLWSVTRTPRELSVVAQSGACPAADAEDRGWRCLYVRGPIPFELTGVVAGLTSVIAAQSLPVFVLSTFDSDLLLLRGESLDRSLRALRDAGYRVQLPSFDLGETGAKGVGQYR